MSTVREYQNSWHQGVVTTAETAWPPGANSLSLDQTLANSTPRAWNNVFGITAGRAVPSKRQGCTCMNRTPLTDSPAIIGQTPYWHRHTDASVHQHHILVGDDGSIADMDESGTVTALGVNLTPGFYPPDFATLNNLCFIVNGQDAKKVNDETVQTFGIVAPAVGSATGNGGVAGNLNGTYEVRFTYYNSDTGHESSVSETAFTVTLANVKLDLTSIPQSSDSQVDFTRVYIRNTATQAKFYRLDAIADGTTTATVDVDTVDTDLATEAPGLHENDPPPSGVKYVVAHRNRLFVASDTTLYWSRTGLPEAFDSNAFDYVNQNDGQRITGFASLPGGYLVIFKENSYYILEGDTPGTWTISRFGPTVGNVSHRSTVIGTDGVYWYAQQGPVKLPFGNLSAPDLIGLNRISGSINAPNVNMGEAARISATFDLANQRVLFAVPETRQTRATKLLVWNCRLDAWESDRWDPIDAASLTTLHDANDVYYAMVGGYAGQVFKLNYGNSDGVSTGTTSGTFVASATTHTTITDATAAFDTTGGKLIERKVIVLDSLNQVMSTTPKPRVTTNTGTVLTLSGAVSGLTIGATYTYIVGGQDWQFDTAWRDLDKPFDKKRLEFIYLMAMLSGRSLWVDVLRNQRGSTLQVDPLVTVTGDGALWNSFNWNDGTLWDTADVTYARLRAAQTGTTFAIRVRNPYPSQPMLLLQLGLRAELLDDKLG